MAGAGVKKALHLVFIRFSLNTDHSRSLFNTSKFRSLWTDTRAFRVCHVELGVGGGGGGETTATTTTKNHARQIGLKKSCTG